MKTVDKNKKLDLRPTASREAMRTQALMAIVRPDTQYVVNSTRCRGHWPGVGKGSCRANLR